VRNDCFFGQPLIHTTVLCCVVINEVSLFFMLHNRFLDPAHDAFWVLSYVIELLARKVG
jgi:hypothetical protein